MTAVKICGLTRPEDARMAASAGADYLGVVFGPSPRRQTVQSARVIWDQLEPRRVGVFVDAPVRQMERTAGALGLAVVQLHGSEGPEVCRRVREFAGVSVWKAVRVGTSGELRDGMERYAEEVDGILLEGRSERGHGGVGAGFDWKSLATIRGEWPTELQLVLAGGLNPDNVGQAVATARPDVVDVSSGVEASVGVKDTAAVRAFIDAAARGGG